MRAYLVYHKEEAVKNQRFVSLFVKAGRESGIEFSYVPYENYREEELPDLVLNRTRDAKVSRWYEERQVPVFHSSHITEIGNHKGKTLDFLRGRLPKEVLQTKWAPETVPISKERLAKWQSALSAGDFEALHELKSFQEQGKPFVIKSVESKPKIKSAFRQRLYIAGNGSKPQQGYQGVYCGEPDLPGYDASGTE